MVVLNGVDFTSTVASALVFNSVFEGDNTWKDQTTHNGVTLHILAGLGNEEDGIDTNRYFVINGGNVVALGSTMDRAESDDSETLNQLTMNMRFTSSQSADEAIIITDTDNKLEVGKTFIMFMSVEMFTEMKFSVYMM